MRKTLSLALLVGISVLVYAQQPGQYTAESDHYRVISETSQSQADDISRRMEAALALYNGIFHFDLSLLPARFTVKVFKDAGQLQRLRRENPLPEENRLRVHRVVRPRKSELLCFPREERAFTSSLLHQGTIQFLKGFVDNPPLWLREGVATYLDASLRFRGGSLHLQAELLWLDSLKSEIRGESPVKFIPLTDLLDFTRETAQSQQDIFAPESWGLVQFLLNSPDSGHNRLLWDSISSLDPKATLESNSARVRKRAFSWVTEQKLRQDFDAYILSLKTGSDLVREGIDFYGKGDFTRSEQALTGAVDVQPDASAAWYYLGLIAYARKDYARADEMYMKAFQLGANAAIINYALGVNAFAAGKERGRGEIPQVRQGRRSVRLRRQGRRTSQADRDDKVGAAKSRTGSRASLTRARSAACPCLRDDVSAPAARALGLTGPRRGLALRRGRAPALPEPGARGGGAIPEAGIRQPEPGLSSRETTAPRPTGGTAGSGRMDPRPPGGPSARPADPGRGSRTSPCARGSSPPRHRRPASSDAPQAR